jgi:hypothetical protein
VVKNLLSIPPKKKLKPHSPDQPEPVSEPPTK